MNDSSGDELPTTPAPQGERPARWFRTTSASSVGIEIAVAVCAPTLLGRWADGQWPDFAPLGVVLGLVIGCGGAVRAVQRTLRDYRRELAQPSDPQESAFVPGSVAALLEKATKARMPETKNPEDPRAASATEQECEK